MATKETTTTKTPKDIIGTVLEETSQERRIAHVEFNKATRELQDRIDQINEDTKPIAQAFTDAKADVAAHQRFQSRMKRQDWDARKRVLDHALAEAQAAFRATQRTSQEAIAPLQELQKSALEKCKELAQEWAAHQRIAKAAEIDLSAYWTPEKGPAEEIKAAEPNGELVATA